MKLLRYLDDDGPALGLLVDDEIIGLDPLRRDHPTMMSLIAGGPAALARVRDLAASIRPSLSLDRAALLAPLERPGKYLAIGMNYMSHAEEAARLGYSTGAGQLWFNKQTTCIAGPHDPIDPGVSVELDYEVELGAVIGRAARCVDEAAARDHVFGWLVANDVSARDWQRHSPTFTVGKSFDTHGPIGPWITTADELPDPHDLAIRCYVNGELRQDSRTSRMIADVWRQIAYLSTAFTLEPGDLLATGTPDGVGVAMDPPHFLKPGDLVRCEIERLGRIENRVG